MGLTWKDALSHKDTVSSNTAAERLSVLYILAVMHYNLAYLILTYERDGVYGKAASSYWVASAIFEQVRKELEALRFSEHTEDFSDVNLYFCFNQSKARAQLCVMEGAKLKFGQAQAMLIAKAAICASDLFGVAYSYANSPLAGKGLKMEVAGETLVCLQFYTKVLVAFAYYQAALHFGDEKSKEAYAGGIGKCISCLNVAAGIFAELDKGLAKQVPALLRTYYTNLTGEFKPRKAYFENLNKQMGNLEYPSRPPEIVAVGIPKPADLKVHTQAPFPGEDRLKSLVPAVILDLEAEYKAEVKEKRGKIEAWEAQREAEEEKFKSDRGLPRCIYNADAPSSSHEIPPALVEKLRKVQKKGGLDKLKALLKRLQGERGNWALFLPMVKHRLEKEAAKFAQYLAQHGPARWTQVPSETASAELKATLAECTKQAEAGEKRFSVFKGKVEGNSEELKLITLTMTDINELTQEVPKSVIVSSVKENPTIVQYLASLILDHRLTKLMEGVGKLTEQRKGQIKKFTEIAAKDEIMKEMYNIAGDASRKSKVSLLTVKSVGVRRAEAEVRRYREGGRTMRQGARHPLRRD